MDITTLIIIITTIVSLLAFRDRSHIYRKLAFSPYEINKFKQYYRFLSYALVHADWMHLFINMLVLYSFGRVTESYYTIYFGNKVILYFLLLYIGAIAISVLPSFGKNKDNYLYTAVGASGAVSAVVFASILFSPLSKLILFPIPIPIPAILFAVLYLGYSYYMSKKNIDNIGHDVHFWGALYGFVFTVALKPSLFLSFIAQIKNAIGF